jgi:uridine phosphorylase
VREDGLSKTYVDQVYPAVSDFEITSLLKVKSEEFDFAYKLGICRSHESFYIDHNQEVIDYWSSKNVLASDMETASLFTLANLRGVRAASVLNVVVNDAQDSSAGINSYVNQEEVVMEGERREIKIALEALAEYNS